MQNVTVDNLALICGSGEYSSIQTLTEAVVTRLTDLVDAAQGLLAALSCDSLIPLYVSESSNSELSLNETSNRLLLTHLVSIQTNTFYQGTCEYSVQGVTWTFASFLVIAVFGMLMITFRTAYLPTQDADAEKLQMAPMDYNEEVEYNPSEALTPQDDDGNVEEAYGLEQADDTGANVATGVAVGAAAAAGTAAVVGSSMQKDDDDRVEDMNQQASVSQDTSDFHQSIQQEHPRSFDDDNWLEDTSPVGAQY